MAPFFLSLNIMVTYTYDCETIKNCYLVIFIDITNPNKKYIFEMSDYKNDFKEYMGFLKHCIKDKPFLVSFNGLEFDAQISYHCIKYYEEFKQLSGGEIARQVFTFVQELIKIKNESGWLMYPINVIPFQEIDLAAINNYNNVQKFASLKWLQFNMDYPNIMDMNCRPEDVLTKEQIEDLKIYCTNDCLSTRALLKRSIELIKIRKTLSKTFGINLQNLSEPKLVKAVLLDMLSKDLGITKAELKTKQTHRQSISLNKIILPYIKFNTIDLQKMLLAFKQKNIPGNNLKGSFKYKVTYRGLTLSFALGGIHGAKRGLYIKEEGMIIKSFDVRSYYPNLCIRNNWSPSHIDNTIFCKRYEWFYDERLKYDKKNPLNYFYKIVLNSAFGLSNDKSSFLRDPELTMKITINGQLLLVMLMEKLCENIPGARPIMVNTDGGEIIFPEQYLSTYYDICKEWELLTSLVLEYEEYEKLILFDVNNYIAIFKPYEITKEKAYELHNNSYPKPLIKKKKDIYYHYPIKLKGRFEIDKELHKNKSYRIKAIAIYNYFVLEIDIEKSIESSKNIFDFCAGIRATKGWKILQTCIEDGQVYDSEVQKTVRYFASTKGCKLIKEYREIAEEDIEIKNIKGVVTKSYKKGDLIIKQEKVEASKTLEYVLLHIDKTIPFESYPINFKYYRKIIQDEIENVQPINSQTLLF